MIFNPLSLLSENALFFASATAFFWVVGWCWRHSPPYELPKPLPGWFKLWFLSMQAGGIGLPIAALLWWGVWQGHTAVSSILLSYLLMLGLQILSESVALRWFQSTVFVMVPYLYIPYRIWQLYSGWLVLQPDRELAIVRQLLLAEIVLWVANYALDLSQLPRLFHWRDEDTVADR
jgi:hypothetical protein